MHNCIYVLYIDISSYTTPHICNSSIASIITFNHRLSIIESVRSTYTCVCILYESIHRLLCTCLHVYKHTYIHILTYVGLLYLLYLSTYIHTYIYLPTYIHRPYIHNYTHLLTCMNRNTYLTT